MSGSTKKTKRDTIIQKIDSAIRFCLYTLVFWIPYSNALIEISIISGLILWIIKRSLLLRWTYSEDVANPLGHVLKSFKPKHNFLNKPIGFFLVVCGLSVWGSSELSLSLRGFFTKTCEWFVVYYLVSDVILTRKHVQNLIVVFLITSFATVLDGIFQFYISQEDIFRGMELAQGRATAAFTHPNGLAGYLTIAIPLVLSLVWLKFKNKIRRFIVGGVFLLMGWTLVITFSRAAWLAVLLGCLFFLYFLNRKVAKKGMLIAGLLIIGIYVMMPAHVKSRSRINMDNIAQTFDWRTGVWEESFRMISDRPFIGHGVNTFMKTFVHYRPKNLERFEYGSTYAHNCYLQMIVEVGWVGFLFFVWMIVRLFRRLRTFFLTVSVGENQYAMVLLGLWSGILAYLIHSAFDVNLYSLRLSMHFWVMVGLTYSIYRLLNNSQNCGIKTA